MEGAGAAAEKPVTARPSIMTAQTISGKNRRNENFPVGSFLIRAGLRPQVHCFYDFARAADDIADDPLLESSGKIRRLDAFDAALAGKSNDVAVAVALRENLAENGITSRHARDLLVAFRRDATRRRYKDLDELLDYCRYSAMPVGRHVLALHGIGQEAWPASDALCAALQIINHMQDMGDDYRELDRVYIPQDMLAAHGASLAGIGHESLGPALRRTLDDIIGLLRPMLEEARDLPRHVPDLRLKAETSVIVALAEAMTARLARRDPLAENARLSKSQVAASAVLGLLRMWT